MEPRPDDIVIRIRRPVAQAWALVLAAFPVVYLGGTFHNKGFAWGLPTGLAVGMALVLLSLFILFRHIIVESRQQHASRAQTPK